MPPKQAAPPEDRRRGPGRDRPGKTGRPGCSVDLVRPFGIPICVCVYISISICIYMYIYIYVCIEGPCTEPHKLAL